MANIFRVQNLLSSAPQQDIITEEHQFLNQIINHLDYLFQNILTPKINHPQNHQDQQHNQAPLVQHKIEEKQIVNTKIKLKKIAEAALNQIYDGDDSDGSPVPSVEEISQFEQNNDDEDDSQPVKKKKIIKTKTTRKFNKLYKNTKKPVSSFVYYYKERLRMIRELKQKRNQAINIGNLAKIISKEWKELDQQGKRPYVAKAEVSLKTYYAEKEKINKKLKLTPLHAKKTKPIKNAQTSKTSEPATMKQPPSGLLAYIIENFERISKQIQSLQRGKIGKAATEQWKRLSVAEKQKYDAYANKNKKKIQQNQLYRQFQHLLSKKKKFKHEEEEYRPKIYKKKMHKQSEDEELSEQLSEEKLEANKNQTVESRDEKKVQMTKPIVQPTSKNPVRELLKQQEGNMNKKLEVDEKKNDKQDNFNNCTVIEVNSNDEQAHECVAGNGSQDDEQFTLHPSKIMHKSEEKRARGPLSPFLLYYQHNLQSLANPAHRVPGSELVKLASTKWVQLSQQEKLMYHTLARLDREQYNQQLDRANGGRKRQTRSQKGSQG